jgi:vacuolar-type H+-ATPase subunit F/Vma7
MSKVVAIGDELSLLGYGLAGAEVVPAEDENAVRLAWNALPSDLGLLVLTATAAGSLQRELEGTDLLWVALPR